MIIKCNADNLDETVREMLKTWSYDLGEKVAKACKETAEEGAKQLQSVSGPYKNRTGKYTRDWSSKLNKDGYRYTKSQYEVYKVYNRKHYQLTHLLENGHRVVSHGHAKGTMSRQFEHIAPIADKLEDEVVDRINRAIEEG